MAPQRQSPACGEGQKAAFEWGADIPARPTSPMQSWQASRNTGRMGAHLRAARTWLRLRCSVQTWRCRSAILETTLLCLLASPVSVHVCSLRQCTAKERCTVRGQCELSSTVGQAVEKQMDVLHELPSARERPQPPPRETSAAAQPVRSPSASVFPTLCLQPATVRLKSGVCAARPHAPSSVHTPGYNCPVRAQAPPWTKGLLAAAAAAAVLASQALGPVWQGAGAAACGLALGASGRRRGSLSSSGASWCSSKCTRFKLRSVRCASSPQTWEPNQGYVLCGSTCVPSAVQVLPQSV